VVWGSGGTPGALGRCKGTRGRYPVGRNEDRGRGNRMQREMKGKWGGVEGGG